MPFVRPDTVIGLDAPVPVMPPGDDVTVYPVMAAPPFDAGAVNVIDADVLPAVAVPIVGAPGTVTGDEATRDMLDGFVSEPLFVTDIVFVPALAGVYVNVPVGVPLLMDTVVGVNVPPPPPSDGVTTTVPVIAPFAPMLKFDDATPTVHVVGPVSVVDVAEDETPAESTPSPSRCQRATRPDSMLSIGAVGTE